MLQRLRAPAGTSPLVLPDLRTESIAVHPPTRRRLTTVVLTLACLAPLAGCEYVRLLRPSVLKQLNPRVAHLVNELPATDDVNKDMIGRLFAHGGAADATVGADGTMRAAVRVPAHEFIWEPAIIIMPRGGTIDLDFSNEDDVLHMAFLPSNGGRQLLEIPIHQRGHARLQLDQPGFYFFGCPVMNHAGRGMLGFIIVKGEVSADAKLDRPAQRRPRH
jgi:PQQ system protein